MLERQSTGVKTIKSDDPFDFDSRLNSFIKSLDSKGIAYEVKVDPTAGLLAFVTYKQIVRVAECVAEEYELVGEIHNCSQCPLYVPSTDGRVKYTRCLKHHLVRKDKPCCDWFYDELDAGRIELKGE